MLRIEVKRGEWECGGEGKGGEGRERKGLGVQGKRWGDGRTREGEWRIGGKGELWDYV